MSKLSVRTTRLGRGLFAEEAFSRGECIAPLCRNIVSGKELPVPYEEAEDRYVQVGPDRYIGPGDDTDYSNHSCDPNAWMRISDGFSAELVALRDINTGDEICWDYSTVMVDDEWTMRCGCGALLCRGIVREFRFLPDEIKSRYRALGIVPSYVNELPMT